MQVQSVELSVSELQDALTTYCQATWNFIPVSVVIRSHAKAIVVELSAGGLISADEFRHRAD